jgi:transcriptional regulator with XRE-family HTH domain
MTKRPLNAEVKKALGLRVLALRKARGLSQAEMAKKCGLHWTYIGGVERGERNPTLTTLRRLAESLGVDLPPLLGRLEKGESPVLTERDKRRQEIVKWLQKGSEAAVALSFRVIQVIIREEKKRGKGR